MSGFSPCGTCPSADFSAGAPQLRLDYLTRFNAPGADPNPFAAARDLSLNRTKIDIPAPLGNIVRMRDLVTELRTFAAEFANLSHNKLQIPKLFAETGGSLTLCARYRRG